MMVAEVGEPRVFPPKLEGKKPVRVLALRLLNDEEEPLKLVVWGDQVADMRSTIKAGAVCSHYVDLGNATDSALPLHWA